MLKKQLIKGSQLGVSLVLAGILSACAAPVKSPSSPQTGAATSTHPTIGIPPASTFSPAQEAQIASIVQSTLMNNPQILVDVVNKLHQQQQAATQQAALSNIAKNAALLTQDALSPSIGPATAKTVVIEFMDYQCSYCHQDYPVVKALIAAHPDVKFIFKGFPIFGAASTYAAKMALAAFAQGKFEAYHNALFETGLMEGQLTNQSVDAVAKKVGVNLTQAKAFIATPGVSQELTQNQSLASSLGIQGTPDFVVMPNSATPDITKVTFLPGAVPEQALEQALAQAQ